MAKFITFPGIIINIEHVLSVKEELNSEQWMRAIEHADGDVKDAFLNVRPVKTCKITLTNGAIYDVALPIEDIKTTMENCLSS